MPDTMPVPDIRSSTAAYLRALLEVSYVYAHIEPTNACNTTCKVCPREAMTRKPRLMRWEVFTDLMDRLLPSPLPMIAFVGFGEPTLHRRLAEMIGYIRAQRSDIVLKMTTNGLLLNETLAASLYDAGLDLIELSVIGGSPEEYVEMMGGIPYERALAAIDALNRVGGRYWLATFPLSETTSRERLSSFWLEAGAKHVEVKGLHRRGGYLSVNNDDFLTADAAMGSYQKRDHEGAIDRSRVDSCHKLYMFLHVNADGAVVPCVQEINSKNILVKPGEARDMSEMIALTRRHRPVFDVCNGCELIKQDLLDYYVGFFAEHFPDRLSRLAARVASAKA